MRAMQAALKRAELNVDDIDYINAHGTSTPLGDEIELGAVKRTVRRCRLQALDVLDQIGDRSSAGRRRRGRGDLLVLAIIEQIVPPTLNLDEPDEGCDIDLVPKQAKTAQGARRPQQLLRLRRHQRLVDLRPRLIAGG